MGKLIEKTIKGRKASPGGQERVEDERVSPRFLSPGHLLEKYHVMVCYGTKLWLPFILALEGGEGRRGRMMY